MINAKIDVMMIDKSRLFQGQKQNKAGTMPKYLDLLLIPTPNSSFSTHMIVQSLPKADRDAGERGPILGNADEVGGQREAPPHQQGHGPAGDDSTGDAETDEEVPF